MNAASIVALTSSTISGRAFEGAPASKGGCGSYSTPSWAISAEGHRDHDHVGRGDVREGPRGHERGVARVILDRASFLGDEEGVIARHIGQHLEGSDDVEECESRVEGESDLHGNDPSFAETGKLNIMPLWLCSAMWQ